jgi:hypothetical protein
MYSTNHKKKAIWFIICILISLLSFSSMIESQVIYSNTPFKSIETTKQQNLKFSSIETISEQWLKNSNFSTIENWESQIKGDNRDIKGVISDDQANYIIIGDSGVKRIDQPLIDGNWTAFNNPEFPIEPNGGYGINSAGCYVSHVWDEGSDQTLNTPSMQWKTNITMPVNMSDYVITSASLEVIFNASVQALDHDDGGIEVSGDYTEGERPYAPYYETQFGVGDSATFYAELSDLQSSFSFPIASNVTTDLGQDDPEVDNYTDTAMNVVPENLLISYLTSSLQTDFFHFTITLGIDIYCEDNEYNADIDNWESLIIRSFNLTFTYEKKIDKFNAINWEQTGNAIPFKNVQIKDTSLNFSCKINQTWPEDLPSNSEVRVLINDNPYPNPDPIKVATLTTNFKPIKINGPDFISLFQKNTNISLSIQIVLLDSFGLDQNITISIDDVYLKITYIIITPKIREEAWLFLLLFIIGCILGGSVATYLILYYKIFRFPKPVRKVRKYKRTLSHKNGPSVFILGQSVAFTRAYNHEVAQTLPTLKAKPPVQKEMTKIEKEPSVAPKQTLENLKSDQLIEKSIEKKEELDKIIDKS